MKKLMKVEFNSYKVEWVRNKESHKKEEIY